MTPDKIIRFRCWHEWETPEQGRDVLAINAAVAAETFVRSLDNWTEALRWRVRVRVASSSSVAWVYDVAIYQTPRFRATPAQIVPQTDRSRQEAFDQFFRTRDARRAANG